MGCEADGCVPGARFVLGGASFRVAKRVGTGAHSVVWQCERVADCKPGRASPTSPVPAEGGGDLALKVGSLGDPSRELAALHLLGPSGGDGGVRELASQALLLRPAQVSAHRLPDT